MSKVVWKESKSVHAEAMHVSRKQLTRTEHGFYMHFYPKRRLPAYVSVCVCAYVHIYMCIYEITLISDFHQFTLLLSHHHSELH